MQISGIQTDVKLGEIQTNLDLLARTIGEEAEQGSRMVVFPECFLTGYCFESLEEAREYTQPLDGEAVSFATDVCSQHNCYTVFGLLEEDGDKVYNALALVGPEGLISGYRKIHLPWLGVDRFTTPGEQPLEVVEAGGVRIGMLICYDGGFPESTRILAIQGADVVLLPTNWPPGAEGMAKYASNTRAMENGIYFAAVNRVGTERGFGFIGGSRICDPTGTTMDAADHTDAAVLRATIDVEKARNKRLVRVPGKHVIDRIADRRPEMYGPLAEPHGLSRPGRDESA